MRDYYPCGACQAYVYYSDGCVHWRARPDKPTPKREFKYSYEPWMNVQERKRFRQRIIKQARREAKQSLTSRQVLE